MLGYSQWRNFLQVVDKAKAAAVNADIDTDKHFADVSKMVEIGSGSRREIQDNNHAVRKMLLERDIVPENLPPAEDVKKVQRKLESDEKKVLKGAKK